ncbi:TPR domain-containing protein [Coniochaeta hoffmannii]|uniref:TPR domain-containing protein n=1 Tax=Coniochaeta hoffmannii TaxID=91930 RepID=A0AA38RA24_9PEZI|nr:TPR domain-containing protein [Coniochaeta hoffmannii]
MSDNDEVIRAYHEAVRTAPQDHPDLGMYLTNLAAALGERYSETWETVDLEESIRSARDATRLEPQSQTDQATWLNNLGIRLSDRYSRLGAGADLEEAIRVAEEAVDTTQHWPARASYMRNLGSYLGERYLTTGVTADIERAIHVTRQSIDLTAADPVQQAKGWNSLGTRLGERYQAEGDANILEEAISALHQAIDQTPELHPARASHLNGLGVHLAARYALIGALTDVENAVDVGRSAVRATPDNKISRALFLHNLGAALGDRYTRTKTKGDLEEAVRFAQETVDLTPNGHPKRPMYLNSLAIRLGDAYALGGSIADLDNIIRVAREAADAIPDFHAARPAYLNNVGIRLLERYAREGDTTALEEGIRVLREALRTTPETSPARATYLVNLGTGLDHRHGCAGATAHADHEEALSHFQAALRQPNASTIKRIAAGIAVLRICAASSDWQQACDASELAVSLIPKLAPRALENADRQHILSQVVGLASDGAAVALQAGRDPTVALGYLEQGRGVLATVLLEMRADILDLQAAQPDLARHFLRLRDELDTPDTHGAFLTDDRENSMRQQTRASRRYDAGNELDRLIAEIHRRPGFSDFLAAPSEAGMRAAASRGPIVVLNTSGYRSDAILVEQHQIRSLALPNLESGHVEKAARSSGLEVESLEWLWDTIARPVLDALGFSGPPAAEGWPHVWWIATGALSKLPIHAAGRHRGGSAGAVLDRVVSSYSSSVKAILHGRRRATPAPVASVPGQALLVEMQDTPGQGRLRFARNEVAVVSDLCRTMGLNPLQPGRLKRHVVTHLPGSKIFHFAGHGLTDAVDPSQSQLLLEDWTADPLSVGTLMSLKLQERAPLMAYLSACGTGQIRNESFLDESIHLIGACQLAGFRHVIGTLWKVDDESCADVARIVYEAIREGGMTDESVARGLHNATKELRGRWLRKKPAEAERRRSVKEAVACLAADGTGGGIVGEEDSRDVLDDDDEALPLHWVPYVHFGV